MGCLAASRLLAGAGAASAATASCTYLASTPQPPPPPPGPAPQIFREIKFFGDAELKATRAERARREEELALLEMRKAVEHLQKMEALLAEQDQRVSDAAVPGRCGCSCC